MKTVQLPYRTEHTAVVFEDNMIVYGGFNSFAYTNSLFMLNLRTFTMKIPPMSGPPPPATSAHSAAVCGEWMYIFGGWK